MSLHPSDKEQQLFNRILTQKMSLKSHYSLSLKKDYNVFFCPTHEPSALVNTGNTENFLQSSQRVSPYSYELSSPVICHMSPPYLTPTITIMNKMLCY